MTLNKLEYKNNYGILFYFITIFIMCYTHIYQLTYKPMYDVIAYQEMAIHYLNNGLLANHIFADLRLYAFPLILSCFYSIFGTESAIVYYTIFTSLSYLILSILIVNKLKKYFIKYNFLHIAFALNIFLIPYLTNSLADGISVLFWMLIFYLILQILDNKNKNIIFLLFFLCSFAIGLSIMIRPSNIILSFIVPILFIMSFLLEQKLNKILVAIVLLSGFFISVSPQIYINYFIFQKITFLPVAELGNSQIIWGIEYIKYATNTSGQGIAQLYYKNPFYIHIDNLQANWYFLNFEQGLKTILLHVFNAFTFDYYFPYIYDLYPKYKNIILLYSWFILFFGVLGMYDLFKNINNNTKDNLRKIKFLVYIILPVIFLSTLSILAISAVENRFSLPLVIILLPFAFHSFLKNIRNIDMWLVFIVWIICAFLISSFVDVQKNIPLM